MYSSDMIILYHYLQLLREAEVHELYVAGSVEQEVLGLQVPVDNINRKLAPDCPD